MSKAVTESSDLRTTSGGMDGCNPSLPAGEKTYVKIEEDENRHDHIPHWRLATFVCFCGRCQ